MTLQDLIDSLAYSEIGSTRLFNHSPANPDIAYEVDSKHKGKLLAGINNALLAICLRVPLYRYSVKLRMVKGITLYNVHSLKSITSYTGDITATDIDSESPDAQYYLYDSADAPYKDNLLSVYRITDGDDKCNIALNDHNRAINVSTPIPFWLKVTEALIDAHDYITVHYKAQFPSIPLSTEDYSNYPIDIPQGLIEAISAHIANTMMLEPNNTEDTGVSLAHKERFEKICDMYSKSGMYNPSDSISVSTFEKLGWI